MKETDYSVKAAAWKMLDYANPAWRPVDYSGFGKNMQCEFPMLRNERGEVVESGETYWARVRSELYKRRIMEKDKLTTHA